MRVNTFLFSELTLLVDLKHYYFLSTWIVHKEMQRISIRLYDRMDQTQPFLGVYLCVCAHVSAKTRTVLHTNIPRSQLHQEVLHTKPSYRFLNISSS